MKEIERITDIQDILLESLSYFDDFCRKNGILDAYAQAVISIGVTRELDAPTLTAEIIRL